MQFLTRNDFLSLIDNATLNVVAGTDDTKLIDAERIAIDQMNSSLSIRYDVNAIFSQTAGDRNALIVMYTVDLALYFLHAKASPDNIPTLRKDRYTDAQEWLDKVADGFISPLLPNKAADEKIPLRYGSSTEKQNDYY